MNDTAENTETITIPDTLRDIGERLRTQNNRATAEPIFLLHNPEMVEIRKWLMSLTARKTESKES